MSAETGLFIYFAVLVVLIVVTFVANIKELSFLIFVVAIISLIAVGSDKKSADDKIDGAIEYEVTNGISSQSDRYKVLETPTATDNGKIVLFDEKEKKVIIRKSSDPFYTKQ